MYTFLVYIISIIVITHVNGVHVKFTADRTKRHQWGHYVVHDGEWHDNQRERQVRQSQVDDVIVSSVRFTVTYHDVDDQTVTKETEEYQRNPNG